MRLVASAVAAVFVTLVLFYFMQSMISRPGKQIEKPEISVGVSLVQVKQNAETADSVSGRALPSPPSSLPTPLAAARIFDDFKAPEIPPAEVGMPDLAAVRPGGKPYLGAYTAPLNKKLPATESTLSNPAPSKLPKPAKLVEKPISKPVIERAMSPNTPADQTNQADLKVMQSGTGTLASSGLGMPTAGPGWSGNPAGTISDAAYEEVVALMKTAPDYPRKAARSKQEGWVKIEFTITEKGAVIEPKVIASKPRRIFDRAALKAIRKWRFKPKTVDGKAVARRAVQVIEFRLAAG